MTGFFVMKKNVKKEEEILDKKIQDNYYELKKKSDRTERFITLANNLKLDDKDIPKTEKGMNSKAKEIIKALTKKLNKEEKKSKD